MTTHPRAGADGHGAGAKGKGGDCGKRVPRLLCNTANNAVAAAATAVVVRTLHQCARRQHRRIHSHSLQSVAPSHMT